MNSGEGESRPKTKVKDLISDVPEMGDVLCSYTADWRYSSHLFC